MSVELEQYLTSLGIEESSSQIYAEYLASGCSVFTLFDLQDKQPSVTQLYDVGITLLADRLLIANAYADATPHTVESFSELPRPRSASKPEPTHSKSTRRSLTKKFSNNAFIAKPDEKKEAEERDQKGDDSSEESKESKRNSKRSSSRAISFHMFTINTASVSDPVTSRKDRIDLSPKPKSDDKPEHRSHRASEKLKSPNKSKKPASKIEAVQLGQKKRRNSFDATYLPNSTPVYSATYSKFEQIEVTKLKEEGVIFSNETDVLGATIKQIISFFLRISQDKSKLSAFVVAYRHFFTLNEFMRAVDEVYTSSLNDENLRECVISTRVANLLKVLIETEFKSFPEFSEAQNKETHQLFDELVKKILKTNFSIGTHLSLQLEKSLQVPESPTERIDVQPLPESIADAERDVLLLLHETAVSAYAFDFLAADPAQLARQLFCIDLRLMQAILPGDLYNVKWVEEGRSRHIEAAVRLTNNLTYFLISQVVKQLHAKDRVQALTHIINFASELLAVQNFNSLLSVYLFFKNRSITQLEKCTLSRLDRRAKERLTDILITMDPLNNFFNYRAYFETLLPPKICCLEVALKDLLFESESSPNRITPDALTHLLTNEQRQKRQSNPWDAHQHKHFLAVDEPNNQNSSSVLAPLHSPHALALSDPADSHSPSSTPPSTTRAAKAKSVSFSIAASNNNAHLNAPEDAASTAPLIYNIGKLIKMGLLIDQITLRHVQHDIERDEPMQRALHSLLCTEDVSYDPDELHALSSALLMAVTKSNSSNALQFEKDTLNNNNGSPSGDTSRNTSPANSSRNLIVNSRSPPTSNHTSPRDSPQHRSCDGAAKERKDAVSFAHEATTIAPITSHSDRLTQRIASKVTRSPIKRVPIGSTSAPVTEPDSSVASSQSSDALSSNPQIHTRTFSASALLGDANNSLFG